MAGLITSNGTGGGNWSAGASWNGGTKPGTGDWVEIAAGDTITLDENTATLGSAGIANVSGSNTSVLAIGAGSWEIKGNVTYSGTSTGGFVTVGNGATLLISGKVTQGNAAGYAVKTSGTGALTVTVSAGSIAVECQGTGQGVNSTGTGAIIVNGNVKNTSSGYGVYATSSSTGQQLNGNVEQTGTGYGWRQVAGTMAWTPYSGGVSSTTTGGSGIHVTSGTVNVLGNLSTVNNAAAGHSSPITVLGTMNWTGDRTLADAAECRIALFSGGTLNLATAAAHLALANSGTFVISNSGGTLNTAATGEHNTAASIVNQVEPSATVGSFAAILGGTAAQRGIITFGPQLLPAENKVDSGEADYGFLADPKDPSYAPDFPAVANVLEADTTNGSQGTYHAPDAAEVLSSAVFGPASGTSGTYVAVAAGDVEAGVTFGAASAETGTFVVPAEEDVELDVEYGDSAEFTGTLSGGGGVIIVRHS